MTLVYGMRLLLACVVTRVAVSLTCKSDSKGLKVEFTKVSGANYYEVQVASKKDGPPFAAQATEAAAGGYVHIYGALKGHTYYVRLRSHSNSRNFRLLHGWSSPGAWHECHYPKALAEKLEYRNETRQLVKHESVAQKTSFRSGRPEVETFNLGVLRQSKASQPDYLDEKNGAGYKCDAAYSHSGGLVQLFCVTILKKTFSESTVFSYHDTKYRHYPNYLSCNKMNGPLGFDDYQCSPMVSGDCHWMFGVKSSKRCSDISSHTKDSRQHVGKIERDLPGKGWDPDYNAYSFPAKAECREHQNVGDSGCTWKRMSHFRMVKVPKGGFTPKEMENALHGVPLKKWECATLDDEVIV